MIVTTNAQIRDHFPDASSPNYENFLPFLKEAEAKYNRIFPSEIYDFAETPGTNETKVKIQYWSQRYIVLLAIYNRLPQMVGLLSEKGIQVHWSEDHRPATESQIKMTRHSVLQGAHKALDELILVLNASTLTEWKDSDKYKQRNRLLFKNADDFSANYINIEGSERFFHILNQHIYRAQVINIGPIIGTADLILLVDKVHKGTLSAEEKLLVDKCCVYLANISMSKALKTVSEEDIPVSILSTMDARQREAYSLELAETARIDLERLQNYKNDLDTPEEAPHEIKPDNSDATKKTFRT